MAIVASAAEMGWACGMHGEKRRAITNLFFSSFTVLTILAYLCLDMFYILGVTTHFGSDEHENKLN